MMPQIKVTSRSGLSAVVDWSGKKLPNQDQIEHLIVNEYDKNPNKGAEDRFNELKADPSKQVIPPEHSAFPGADTIGSLLAPSYSHLMNRGIHAVLPSVVPNEEPPSSIESHLTNLGTRDLGPITPEEQSTGWPKTQRGVNIANDIISPVMGTVGVAGMAEGLAKHGIKAVIPVVAGVAGQHAADKVMDYLHVPPPIREIISGAVGLGTGAATGYKMFGPKPVVDTPEQALAKNPLEGPVPQQGNLPLVNNGTVTQGQFALPVQRPVTTSTPSTATQSPLPLSTPLQYEPSQMPLPLPPGSTTLPTTQTPFPTQLPLPFPVTPPPQPTQMELPLQSGLFNEGAQTRSVVEPPNPVKTSSGGQPTIINGTPKSNTPPIITGDNVSARQQSIFQGESPNLKPTENTSSIEQPNEIGDNERFLRRLQKIAKPALDKTSGGSDVQEQTQETKNTTTESKSVAPDNTQVKTEVESNPYEGMSKSALSAIASIKNLKPEVLAQVEAALEKHVEQAPTENQGSAAQEKPIGTQEPNTASSEKASQKKTPEVSNTQFVTSKVIPKETLRNMTEDQKWEALHQLREDDNVTARQAIEKYYPNRLKEFDAIQNSKISRAVAEREINDLIETLDPAPEVGSIPYKMFYGDKTQPGYTSENLAEHLNSTPEVRLYKESKDQFNPNDTEYAEEHARLGVQADIDGEVIEQDLVNNGFSEKAARRIVRNAMKYRIKLERGSNWTRREGGFVKIGKGKSEATLRMEKFLKDHPTKNESDYVATQSGLGTGLQSQTADKNQFLMRDKNPIARKIAETLTTGGKDAEDKLAANIMREADAIYSKRKLTDQERSSVNMILDGKTPLIDSTKVRATATELKPWFDKAWEQVNKNEQVGRISEYFPNMEKKLNDTGYLGRSISMLDNVSGGAWESMKAMNEMVNSDGVSSGKVPSSRFFKSRPDKQIEVDYASNRVIPAYARGVARLSIAKQSVLQAKALMEQLPEGITRDVARQAIDDYAGYTQYPTSVKMNSAITRQIMRIAGRAILAANPKVAFGLHFARAIPIYMDMANADVLSGIGKFAKNPMESMQRTMRDGIIPGQLEPWRLQKSMQKFDTVTNYGNVAYLILDSIAREGIEAGLIKKGMSPELADITSITKLKNSNLTSDQVRQSNVYSQLNKSLLAPFGQFGQPKIKIIQQYLRKVYDVTGNSGLSTAERAQVFAKTATATALAYYMYKQYHAPTLHVGEFETMAENDNPLTGMSKVLGKEMMGTTAPALQLGYGVGKAAFDAANPDSNHDMGDLARKILGVMPMGGTINKGIDISQGKKEPSSLILDSAPTNYHNSSSDSTDMGWGKQ